MTVISSRAGRPPAHLAATRAAWHSVAEHVLAPARYAATGHIGLVPAPGGFRTPPFGAAHRFLAVDGGELVVGAAAGTRRAPLTTIRAAAAFAGVTPGAPAQVYTPATPLDLDRPLTIDPGSARLLAGWYRLGEQAMSGFAAEFPDEEPGAAVLWPEHFDLGITVGSVNYGASPGDGHCADPYVYVSPHNGPPPGEPAFWNAPFGAIRTIKQISTADEAAGFFRDARSRLHPAPARPPGRMP
jgi:hypothetical protein